MEPSAGIIIFLITQTVAAIWWASTITVDVRYIKDNIKDFKVDTKDGHEKLSDRLDRLEREKRFAYNNGGK